MPLIPTVAHRLPFFTIASSATLILILAGTGCRKPGPENPKPEPGSPQQQVTAPDLRGVEANIFLVGDAGYLLGQGGTLRVQEALADEIRKDPERTERVRILYLGDNVYPAGVPQRGLAFERAVRILHGQMRAAGEMKVRVWFVPGNHDWENGLDGVIREGEIIDKYPGNHMSLLPGSGCPGPVVQELGERLAIIFFDTGWWLHKARGAAGCPQRTQSEVLLALEAALREAANEGRHTVVAAHHPLESYGSHAGRPNNEQDLDGRDYCAMRESLERIFRSAASPPLIFAAGHDHALQVIRERRLCALRTTGPQQAGVSGPPPFQLVSGTGAKVTELEREVPSSSEEYAKALTGFMQVLVYSNGGVRVDVLEVQKTAKATRRECFWLAGPVGSDVSPCRNWAR